MPVQTRFKPLYLGLLPLLWGLTTAQVPYEYFELKTIEPPVSLNALNPKPDAVMPTSLHLDQQTQAAGDLTLSEPFAPPVGIYKRKTVFSQIRFRDEQHDAFIITPNTKPCIPWSVKSPPKDYTIHRSALIHVNAVPGIPQEIPSDSPEMIITSIRVERVDNKNSNDFTLLKCPDDLYMIQIQDTGLYQIEYETVSPQDAATPKKASFFLGKTFEQTPLDTPDIQRIINELIEDEPKLTQIVGSSNTLSELILYFQQYKSEPLDISDLSNEQFQTERTILKQHKGLCRHRAFMLMLIARSLGYPVRIAANEIHAFIEIKADGRWHPIELGGQANSLTIQPTSPTSSTHIISNFSFDNPPATSQSSSKTQQSELFDSTHSENHSSIQGLPEKADSVFQNEKNSIINQNNTSKNGNSFRENRHSKDFIFVPIENLPKRLTRDSDISISGQMLNNQFTIMPDTEFALEIIHSSRRLVFYATSDKDGKVSVQIRLPADWPLGKTETRWKLLQSNEQGE